MNVIIYAGLSVLLHQNSMFSVPEGLCARVVATAARHLSRDIRLHDTCRLSVVTTHYPAECYLYIVLASRNLYLPQLRAQLKTSHINYQGIIQLFLDSVQYRFYFSKYQLILRSIILAMKIGTFNCRFRNMQYFNLSIFLWCLCRMFSMNISILS